MALPKVTTKLPLLPIALDTKWKHLTSIQLGGPDVGVLGNIDILLGVDIFSCVVRQGWQLGPSGSSVAINTSFGWVLSGTVGHEHPQQQVTSCFSTTLTSD